MKKSFFTLFFLYISFYSFPQENNPVWYNDYLNPIIDTIPNFLKPWWGKVRVGYIAVVYIDFPDGRYEENGEWKQPFYNWQLDLVSNKEAAGEVGVIKDNGNFYLQAAKYTWQDRWNMLFDSLGIYRGTMHPDNTSHNILAYGSMKEYWKQASNSKFDLQPYLTHPNESDYKLRTGIINEYEEINGQKVIKTLVMPKNKFGTDNGNSYFRGFYDADDLVAKAEMLIGDADSVINKQTNFDLASFRQNGGILMIVFSGGSNSFKGVGYGGKGFVVRGRINPLDSLHKSRTDGFGIMAHEFAHLQFNWMGHVNAARYCLMNVWEVHHPDCPQFPNPVYRMKEGWLNTIAYTNSQHIDSLPPIETSYKCGVVTIYGKPSAKPDWTCGESYIIENRKKILYDSFMAPYTQNPIDFKGGLLVWKYSPYNTFLQDTNCGKNFYSDVELVLGDSTLSHQLCGSQGYYKHFFACYSDQNNILISNRTISSFGLPTGIALENIQQNNYNDPYSTIRLDINYYISEPPNYNIILWEQTTSDTVNLSGNVFVHSYDNWQKNLYINPGTYIDLIGGSLGINGNNYNKAIFRAMGQDVNLITLRGAGYGNYRVSRNTYCLNISVDNNSSTDTNILKYCQVEKSAGTISISTSNSSNRFVIENNNIEDTANYLELWGPTEININDYQLISKYENNSCNLFLNGKIKFDINNDLIINQNKKLRIDNTGGERGLCELNFVNSNKIYLNGIGTIIGNLKINKDIFVSGTGKIVFPFP